MKNDEMPVSKTSKGNGTIKPRQACLIGPLNSCERRRKALRIRTTVAQLQDRLPSPDHPCNGDESRYPNKIGSFTKGLPHNGLGEVDLNAYHAFIAALKTGKDFESIPLGGVVKIVNPQASYAFDLVGPDSHHLGIASPPAFSSSWEASEMAEVYWQALTRDVPFTDYDTHPLTLGAASDLTVFSDFRGPKVNGAVTTGSLFRGDTPGDIAGPYISQFLWKDIPFGATTVVQRYRTTIAGDDHMTSYEEWLRIQNGSSPNAPNVHDPISRYIRNGRDLGEYVHVDFSYQSVLSACLILLSYGKNALDPANPYFNSATQSGFSTFGAPYVLDWVARTARSALDAAWFQKFLVHRRLRPEEFGGCVHNQLTGAANYEINSELLDSQAVSETFNKFGSYLLPAAYAEGSPIHPAYPSGHACLAGAGVTVLKAFFNESFPIPHPVAASSDGLSLLPYLGSLLTIGGELNKFAANIALGRDAAGIHWRSDGIEGLKLGEAVAIGMLQDYKKTYHEDFCGFSLTRFDGTTITIG